METSKHFPLYCPSFGRLRRHLYTHIFGEPDQITKYQITVTSKYFAYIWEHITVQPYTSLRFNFLLIFFQLHKNIPDYNLKALKGWQSTYVAKKKQAQIGDA